MGLITWIAVVVTILAIMGLGWNVFVSGVYKGAQKIMGNSTFRNVPPRSYMDRLYERREAPTITTRSM
jgi:hypothetical protein